MEKNRAIILGSGPTGLISAWKLLEKGLDVLIIEKNSNSGGLCRSWKHNGFILDTGPHIFHTPDEELRKFWKSNFRDLLIEGKFYCKNVKGEKMNEFYDYPFSKEALNNFDNKTKKKIKAELHKCKNLEKRFKAKNYKEYISLPEYTTMIALFKKGIGIHHAGILSIFREITEMLFEQKKILLGIFLMISLDLVMEPVAPVLDFWTFKSGLASFQNYLGWSLVSFPLHILYQKLSPKISGPFPFHLFILQFLFFTILLIKINSFDTKLFAFLIIFELNPPQSPLSEVITTHKCVLFSPDPESNLGAFSLSDIFFDKLRIILCIFSEYGLPFSAPS